MHTCSRHMAHGRYPCWSLQMSEAEGKQLVFHGCGLRAHKHTHRDATLQNVEVRGLKNIHRQIQLCICAKH